MPDDVKKALSDLTVEAVELLAKCIRDDEAPWPSRVAAADKVLDRNFGKPPQQVDVGGQEDNPVRITDPNHARNKLLPLIVEVLRNMKAGK